MTAFFKESNKNFALKAAGSAKTRVLDGVAYTIDEKRDLHGDLVKPGAFDEGIAEFNAGLISTKMRDHHKVTVGAWTAMQMIGAELTVKGNLLPTDEGKNLGILIDGKAVDKLSIGIDERRSEWDLLSDPPGRLWTKIFLAEISPVSFPAKTATSITSLKGAEATRLGAPQHGRSFAIMLAAAIAAKGIEAGEGQATTIERIAQTTGLELIDVYALLIEDHPVRPSQSTIKALGDLLAPTSDEFMTSALADGFVYVDEHDEPETPSEPIETPATTSPSTTVSITIETKGDPMTEKKTDVAEPIAAIVIDPRDAKIKALETQIFTKSFETAAIVIDPRDAKIKALETQIFTKSFETAVAARKCSPADKPRFERLFEASGLKVALEWVEGATPRGDLAATTVGSSTAGIATKSAAPVDDGLYAARVAVKNGYISKASFDAYVAAR